MRARTLALAIGLFLTLPGVAFAAPTFLNGYYHLTYPHLCSDQNNYLCQVYKTAFRDGDQGYIFVGYDELPTSSTTVTADLSLLAATSSAAFVDDSYDFVTHDFLSPAFTVQTGSATGPINFTIAATAGDGSITATTETALVDNAPPTFSLDSSSFQVSGPHLQYGDTLTIQGSINGTGSPARLEQMRLCALYSDGAVSPPSSCVGTGPNATDIIPDGPYSIPLNLNSFVLALSNVFPPGVVGMRLTVTVADGAENQTFLSKDFALPSGGVSSVLFLPGVEGSRLYTKDAGGFDHELWEPSLLNDVSALALNADGSSKSQIYTKDLVDSIYGSAALSTANSSTFMVYGSFEHFMDSLVISGTLKEWRAYPYDWRYDVFDIINNGTLTEQPDGTLKQVYLADVLKQMASSSPTGKVTIVAHSNGGLLAKALATTLGADASKYIDRIVMIGTPQFGTPAAIGGLLHGDNVGLLEGLIVGAKQERAAANTMPGLFGLLPSNAYFANIANPVVSFDPSAASAKYALNYGSYIVSFNWLVNFLKDSASIDTAPSDSTLALLYPVPLSAALIQKESAMHSVLDAWTPPVGIQVTSIAGWGQNTTSGLLYKTKFKVICSQSGSGSTAATCLKTSYLAHTPLLTQDGDDTVVSPSAAGNFAQKLYLNTTDYRNHGLGNIVHQNLTSANPIQALLTNILTGQTQLPTYISTTKPANGLNPLTVIASHSPVNIVVTDASGNQGGVIPIPGTDFAARREDIPGSSVDVLDDEEYVYVPTSGAYTVSVHGYDVGLTTLDVGTVLPDGSASTTASFGDIPTTASTTASFNVSNGTATIPQVDLDGNGTIDLAPPTPSDPLVYTRYIEVAIRTYNLDSKFTRQLESKLANVEYLLLRSNKWDDGDDDSRDTHTQDRTNLRIQRKLDLISAYINSNLPDSKPKKSNAQPSIPLTTASALLDMISVLRSLVP